MNTRRQFVAGAACVAMALHSRILKGESAVKEITLAPLPYADDALAPTVSAKTISFHYGKHHAGYVKTLNGLIAGTKYEGLSLGEIVAASRDAGDTAIFNNAAQIWNHDFYWRSLAPAGTGGEPSSELLAAINASFGSLDACKTALADAAVKRFGSGWAWLLVKDGKLVNCRREGKTIYYFLADNHVRTIIGQGFDHLIEERKNEDEKDI